MPQFAAGFGNLNLNPSPTRRGALVSNRSSIPQFAAGFQFGRVGSKLPPGHTALCRRFLSFEESYRPGIPQNTADIHIGRAECYLPSEYAPVCRSYCLLCGEPDGRWWQEEGEAWCARLSSSSASLLSREGGS
jgi:hypothetical protein